jgi:hypothetical protein
MPTISAAAIGAVANWPKEPPALTMPVAKPRRPDRSCACWPTSAPRAGHAGAARASTPIAKIRPSVVVM